MVRLGHVGEARGQIPGGLELHQRQDPGFQSGQLRFQIGPLRLQPGTFLLVRLLGQLRDILDGIAQLRGFVIPGLEQFLELLSLGRISLLGLGDPGLHVADIGFWIEDVVLFQYLQGCLYIAVFGLEHLQSLLEAVLGEFALHLPVQRSVELPGPHVAEAPGVEEADDDVASGAVEGQVLRYLKQRRTIGRAPRAGGKLRDLAVAVQRDSQHDRLRHLLALAPGLRKPGVRAAQYRNDVPRAQLFPLAGRKDRYLLPAMPEAKLFGQVGGHVKTGQVRRKVYVMVCRCGFRRADEDDGLGPEREGLEPPAFAVEIHDDDLARGVRPAVIRNLALADVNDLPRKPLLGGNRRLEQVGPGRVDRIALAARDQAAFGHSRLDHREFLEVYLHGLMGGSESFCDCLQAFLDVDAGADATAVVGFSAGKPVGSGGQVARVGHEGLFPCCAEKNWPHRPGGHGVGLSDRRRPDAHVDRSGLARGREKTNRCHRQCCCLPVQPIHLPCPRLPRFAR